MAEYTFEIYAKYWPQKAVDEMLSAITQKLSDSRVTTTVSTVQLEKPSRIAVTLADAPANVKLSHEDIAAEINKRFPDLVSPK